MEIIYEMIKQSMRLYSLQEINVMFDKGEITPEFKEYLEIAPESVKVWIKTRQGAEYADEIMSADVKVSAKDYPLQEKRGDIASSVDVKEGVSAGIDSIAEAMTDDSGQIENSETVLIAARDKNTEQQSKLQGSNDAEIYEETVTLTGDTEPSWKQDKEELKNNPYAKLKFTKRIYVQRLIIHEQVNTSCEKHMMPYTDIQVLIQLRKGKYSLVTLCCPMCKKLYMDEERYNGMRSLFKKKQMDYEWIPSREE